MICSCLSPLATCCWPLDVSRRRHVQPCRSFRRGTDLFRRRRRTDDDDDDGRPLAVERRRCKLNPRWPSPRRRPPSKRRRKSVGCRFRYNNKLKILERANSGLIHNSMNHIKHDSNDRTQNNKNLYEQMIVFIRTFRRVWFIVNESGTRTFSLWYIELFI